MSSLKVIGHLNPDTDSTCTPVVYAWFLTEIKGQSAQPILAGEPNREALYLLERFNTVKPEIVSQLNEGEQIVLMDTNNAEELISGWEKSEIVEIVDHHKLFGNISTEKPVSIVMSPVACVATIVWEMIVSSVATSKVSADHAGLLLGSILSDTLKFSSPTTTQRDRDAAAALAEIAGVSVNELAEKMFAAKSDLTGMSAQDIIMMDSKAAEFADKKIRVSVLETVKPENALAMKDELIIEICKLKAEQGLAHLPLFIVDILSTSSTVIMADEADKELVGEAFGVQVSVDRVNLPGVVSRKKQMLPALEKALSDAN